MKLKYLAALAMLTAVPSVLATGVEPMNLADLTYKSIHIFEGRCIAVEHTKVGDENGELPIPTVRYTFEVIDKLKGETGQTIVISQLGKSPAGEPEFPVDPDWVGMPRYEAGETYLLFMAPVGPTGLRSPMGTSQGTFRVVDQSLDLMVDEGSYLFFGFEKLLSQAEYKPIMDGIRAKQGDKAMLDKSAFKTLVRDLLSGKVTAPVLREVIR